VEGEQQVSTRRGFFGTVAAIFAAGRVKAADVAPVPTVAPTEVPTVKRILHNLSKPAITVDGIKKVLNADWMITTAVDVTCHDDNPKFRRFISQDAELRIEAVFNEAEYRTIRDAIKKRGQFETRVVLRDGGTGVVSTDVDIVDILHIETSVNELTTVSYVARLRETLQYRERISDFQS
jgi:hypothetical protein